MSRVLRSTLDALACAVYPTRCALCGSPLPHLSYAPICHACWSEVSLLEGPACARCGDALTGAPSATLCRACRLVPPPFERAVACALYDGRMRDAIHAFKFNGIRPAARVLSRMLAQVIVALLPHAPAEMLVVPVPLHRARYAARGFNQARLLAEGALRLLARTHPAWRLALAPRALLRVRATESQAELTPRQRRLNLRGAFAVSDAAAVAGKHILLVDDIMTTGATARAASRTLLGAGAASVWVATVSRARLATAKPEMPHPGTTALESTRPAGSRRPSETLERKRSLWFCSNPLHRAAHPGAMDPTALPAPSIRWQALHPSSLHHHSSFSS